MESACGTVSIVRILVAAISISIQCKIIWMYMHIDFASTRFFMYQSV